jgi:DNA-binding transcriptional regulator YiaG
MSRSLPIRPGDGDPRHGTTNGYGNLACRCRDCCAANTAAMRKYNERRFAQRRAERAREHERQLATQGPVVPSTGVAARFGCHVRYIDERHPSGKLPRIAIGRMRYIRVADIEAAIAEAAPSDASGVDVDGEAMRAARLEAGLRLVDVGTRVGVDKSTVSYWENGHRRPSRLCAERWREALGMSEVPTR